MTARADHRAHTKPMPPRSNSTHLPQYFAVLYGAMIVYASLQPFSGWVLPLPGTPYFLFAPWPPRYTRFDIAINVIAYVPFGIAVAMIGSRMPARQGREAVLHMLDEFDDQEGFTRMLFQLQ